MSEEEENHAQAFILFTNQVDYQIPEEYWTNDRLLMRILAAEKFDNVKTLKHMIEHSKWQRETFPI